MKKIYELSDIFKIVRKCFAISLLDIANGTKMKKEDMANIESGKYSILLRDIRKIALFHQVRSSSFFLAKDYLNKRIRHEDFFGSPLVDENMKTSVKWHEDNNQHRDNAPPEQ